MQKDSAYLSDAGCYAKTICLSTRFSVTGGAFFSKNFIDMDDSIVQSVM